MGEATRKRTHGGGFSGNGAAIEFLKRFLSAPPGEDICLRDAELENGDNVVACQIGGYTAVLYPDQMRVVAKVMEETMNKFPSFPDTATFPDLILSLRHAADEIERIPLAHHTKDADQARAGANGGAHE